MIKYLFCDIDGTLIKGFLPIPNKSLIAIKKFTDAGGNFILSTGRGLYSIRKIIKKVENTIKKKLPYIVCSSGAQIIDRVNNTTYIHLISDDVGKKILSFCNENHIWIWFYPSGAEDNKQQFVYANDTHWSFITKIFKNINTKRINNNTKLESFKIVCISLSKKKVSMLYKWLCSNFYYDLNIVYQSKYMLEITVFNINKGTAIKHILHTEGSQLSDACAIGNGSNDIPAFEVVPMSISVNTKKKNVVYASTFHYKGFHNSLYNGIMKHVIDYEKKD